MLILSNAETALAFPSGRKFIRVDGDGAAT